MLSFSSFGSTKHPLCDKMRRAVELARYADPTLIIDGEVQGDIAVNAKKLEAAFPFSPLKGGANVLIFPDLESCNIACKLLIGVGGAEAVRPDPHGHGEAGASAAARRRGGRDRQHDHHRGGGRAGLHGAHYPRPRSGGNLLTAASLLVTRTNTLSAPVMARFFFGRIPGGQWPVPVNSFDPPQDEYCR